MLLRSSPQNLALFFRMFRRSILESVFWREEFWFKLHLCLLALCFLLVCFGGVTFTNNLRPRLAPGRRSLAPMLVFNRSALFQGHGRLFYLLNLINYSNRLLVLIYAAYKNCLCTCINSLYMWSALVLFSVKRTCCFLTWRRWRHNIFPTSHRSEQNHVTVNQPI